MIVDIIQECINNAGAISAAAQNMEEAERLKKEETQIYYTISDKIILDLKVLMAEYQKKE